MRQKVRYSPCFSGSVHGTWKYAYDEYGNIRKQTHGNASVSYAYGDAAWVNLLTAINGQRIAYEGQKYVASSNTVTGTAKTGNPISYYNGARWIFTWKNGRELGAASNSNVNLQFDYDVDGLRTWKDVNGVRHQYTYASGRLLREAYTDNHVTYTLDFLYDHANRPYMLHYSTVQGTVAASASYYYLLNLQGDVVGLTDANGKLVAEYDYGPFGEILDAPNGGIGSRNPLRYRGYYYDTETGFYYLQSRYYDPILCRFLNADSYASTGQGFLGYNMFAYCGNKPVMCEDPSGNRMNTCQMLTDSGSAPTIRPYYTMSFEDKQAQVAYYWRIKNELKKSTFDGTVQDISVKANRSFKEEPPTFKSALLENAKANVIPTLEGSALGYVATKELAKVGALAGVMAGPCGAVIGTAVGGLLGWGVSTLYGTFRDLESPPLSSGNYTEYCVTVHSVGYTDFAQTEMYYCFTEIIFALEERGTPVVTSTKTYYSYSH